MGALKKEKHLEILDSQFQIEDMKEKMLQHQKKYRYTQNLCVESEKHLKKLREERDKIRGFLEKSEKQLIEFLENKLSLKQEINYLKVEADEYKLALEGEKNKWESLSEQYIAKETTYADLEKTSKALIDNISSLQGRESQYHKKIASLKNSLGKLGTNKEKVLNALQDLVEQKQTLSVEVDRKNSTLEELHKEIQKQEEHLLTFKSLENQVLQQEKYHAELKSNILVLEGERELLTKSHLDLKSKWQETEALYSSAKLELKKEKIRQANIAKEIQESKTELQELRKQISKASDVEQRLSHAEVELKNNIDESKKVSKKKEARAKELKQIESKLDEVTSDLSVLSESCRVLKNEETQLVNYIEGEYKKLELLEGNFKEYETQVSGYRQEIEQLKLRKQGEENSIERLKKRYEKEKQDLDASYLEHKIEHDSLVENLTGIKTKIDLAKDEYNLFLEKSLDDKQDFKRHLESLQERKSELVAEISDLEEKQNKKRELEHLIIELESKLEDLKVRESLTMKTHEEMRMDLSRLEITERERINQEMSDLESLRSDQINTMLENAELEAKKILENANSKAQKLEVQKKSELKQWEGAEVRKLELELFEKEEAFKKKLAEINLDLGEQFSDNKTFLDYVLKLLAHINFSWKKMGRSTKWIFKGILLTMITLGCASLVYMNFDHLYKHFKNDSSDQSFVTNEIKKRESRFVVFKKDNTLYESLVSNILYNEKFESAYFSSEYQNEYVLKLNDFILNENELHEDNIIKVLSLESELVKFVLARKHKVPKNQKEMVLDSLYAKEKFVEQELYKIFLTQRALKNYIRFRKDFIYKYLNQ